MVAHTAVAGELFPGIVYDQAPRNVYWETTIACDLACKHCRANAIAHRDPRELSTDEGKRLMDDVKSMGSMLVLTGGDPMKRVDLFELIAYGRALHVPVSITPSTTPSLRREDVMEFKRLGVAAMGVSIDGPTPKVHDGFRGVEGTFENSRKALIWAREAGIPVQINTTVTTETLPHLPELFEFLRDTAAPPVRRWSLFMLVPVGRGEGLGIPTPRRIDSLFDWVYRISADAPFHISTVEAPHYRQQWIRKKLETGTTRGELEHVAKQMGFGVRDGNGVVFVSHVGDVHPAGFLPYLLGNVREQPLSEIYQNSDVLKQLRDMDRLTGKCGACAFRWACGGSRARAFAMTGDLMGSDPFCSYEPEVIGAA